MTPLTIEQKRECERRSHLTAYFTLEELHLAVAEIQEHTNDFIAEGATYFEFRALNIRDRHANPDGERRQLWVVGYRPFASSHGVPGDPATLARRKQGEVAFVRDSDPRT